MLGLQVNGVGQFVEVLLAKESAGRGSRQFLQERLVHGSFPEFELRLSDVDIERAV